jgi:alkylation response protein AidB-like acyl-CoA dehydrogenase
MTTTTSEPIADIESLTEDIRAQLGPVDTDRALPGEVIEALRAADLFRLTTSRDLGGREVDAMTFVRAVEAASYIDGSVGWCVMIAGCFTTFTGYLPPAGAQEIFGDPRSIAAGSFRPEGTAEEVDGGYRVSGRWPFASGSSHAQWFISGCRVTRNGEPVITPFGAPLFREVLTPRQHVEMIDTWDSTGLRGTASHDYAIRDAFVPHERTMWFQDQPTCDRPLFRLPALAMYSTFIAAVPLGIARHAIDEFQALVTAKTDVWSQSALADKANVQMTLGKAYALVSAGRTYVLDRLTDLWSRVERRHAPTLADRRELWLASTHAAHCALEAISMLYTTAGASAVYASCALDRCLRDTRTAVQHICTQESNFELAGKQLLGRLAPPVPWMIDYRGEG